MSLNFTPIATSYNDNEVVHLEDKLTFLNSQTTTLQDEINNLQIVKDSMSQAIGKIKEDRDVKDKRVEHLKTQTEIIKQKYRDELDEAMKEEQQYNKVHKELIYMEERYRNACQYIREKQEVLKHTASKTYFSMNNHQNENSNVRRNLEDPNNDSSIFDDHPLKQVKSVERLSQKEFFRNRQLKVHRSIFSLERGRNANQLTYRPTNTTSRYGQLDKGKYSNLNDEEVDSLLTK